MQCITTALGIALLPKFRKAQKSQCTRINGADAVVIYWRETVRKGPYTVTASGKESNPYYQRYITGQPL